ncbi:hypothetical protein [Rosenbergiella epipactidis]|uniref:hypothetical protein n=1 Tax=Rosenbergiella epipactidis TaxID=1544694 RepID=UPI001F4DE3BE|nr:hypothetical protein [Rosenbergiella epipactidis]
MSNRATLSKIKAKLSAFQSNDANTDIAIISALMDEMSSKRPLGTADSIEKAQHKLTGYSFPHSKELRTVLSQ